MFEGEQTDGTWNNWNVSGTGWGYAPTGGDASVWMEKAVEDQGSCGSQPWGGWMATTIHRLGICRDDGTPQRLSFSTAG
jgi:hypothetical protein